MNQFQSLSVFCVFFSLFSSFLSDFLNVMNLPVGKFVVPGRCMQGVENPYHLESLANSLASVLGKFTPTSQSKRPIRAHKEAAKIILQWNNYYVARPGTSRYHDDHKIIHSNVRDLFRSGFELCKFILYK